MGERCARRTFLVDGPRDRNPRWRAAGRRSDGHLAGWGTIAIHWPSKAGLSCAGEFSATEALGDAGQLRCSDGTAAPFQFQRLSLKRGYGAGTGGSALSFTYGLTAEESDLGVGRCS